VSDRPPYGAYAAIMAGFTALMNKSNELEERVG
jgi:hypothetical protein